MYCWYTKEYVLLLSAGHASIADSWYSHCLAGNRTAMYSLMPLCSDTLATTSEQQVACDNVIWCSVFAAAKCWQDTEASTKSYLSIRFCSCKLANTVPSFSGVSQQSAFVPAALLLAEEALTYIPLLYRLLSGEFAACLQQPTYVGMGATRLDYLYTSSQMQGMHLYN